MQNDHITFKSFEFLKYQTILEPEFQNEDPRCIDEEASKQEANPCVETKEFQNLQVFIDAEMQNNHTPFKSFDFLNYEQLLEQESQNGEALCIDGTAKQEANAYVEAKEVQTSEILNDQITSKSILEQGSQEGGSLCIDNEAAKQEVNSCVEVSQEGQVTFKIIEGQRKTKSLRKQSKKETDRCEAKESFRKRKSCNRSHLSGDELYQYPTDSQGNKIRRPPNAFILFSNQYRGKLCSYGNEKRASFDVSKILGEMWRGLGKEEKSVFEKEAIKRKEDHKKKYPHYVYNPKVARMLKGLNLPKKQTQAKLCKKNECIQEELKDTKALHESSKQPNENIYPSSDLLKVLVQQSLFEGFEEDHSKVSEPKFTENDTVNFSPTYAFAGIINTCKDVITEDSGYNAFLDTRKIVKGELSSSEDSSQGELSSIGSSGQDALSGTGSDCQHELSGTESSCQDALSGTGSGCQHELPGTESSCEDALSGTGNNCLDVLSGTGSSCQDEFSGTPTCCQDGFSAAENMCQDEVAVNRSLSHDQLYNLETSAQKELDRTNTYPHEERTEIMDILDSFAPNFASYSACDAMGSWTTPTAFDFNSSQDTQFIQDCTPVREDNTFVSQYEDTDYTNMVDFDYL